VGEGLTTPRLTTFYCPEASNNCGREGKTTEEANILINCSDSRRTVECADEYMIYLLTAIGLSPGGSTHLHTKIQRTTQITNNVEECGPCPVFESFTLAFALQLRKKHGKTSVRLIKTSVRLIQTSVNVIKPQVS
jgi:hypothetical protein